MANMMDYLDWRGGLTFIASGFNEVDNLLFAELVYTSFDGIVTGQSEAEAVTLAEASAVFWEQNSREEILARVSMTKAAPFVLEKMAKTERFRDVKLWGYVNDISGGAVTVCGHVCRAAGWQYLCVVPRHGQYDHGMERGF